MTRKQAIPPLIISTMDSTNVYQGSPTSFKKRTPSNPPSLKSPRNRLFQRSFLLQKSISFLLFILPLISLYALMNISILSVCFYWTALEVVFYFGRPWFYNWIQSRRQKPYTPILSRRRLYWIVQDLLSHTEDLMEWLRVWLGGRVPVSEVGRDDVAAWIAWSFWKMDYYRDKSNPPSKWQKRVYSILEQLERKMNRLFPPYQHVDCQPLRLGHQGESLVATNHGLWFYVAVYWVHLGTSGVLRWLGFRKGQCHGWVYWYTPCSKPTGHKPLLFIHGIGVGLMTYLPLIYLLRNKCPERPLLLIEQRHVAMRLDQLAIQVSYDPRQFTRTVEEIVEKCWRELKRDEPLKVILMGHSLGSANIGWLVKHWSKGNEENDSHFQLSPESPESASSTHSMPLATPLSPLNQPSFISIDMTIFLDPICFQLWLPRTAHGFLYKPPVTVFDYIMRKWVSLEYQILAFMKDHFCWYENCLWTREIKKENLGKCLVVLSEYDQLVDTRAVAKYLNGLGAVTVNELQIQKDLASWLQVHILPKAGHAGLFLQWSGMKQLATRIQQLAETE